MKARKLTNKEPFAIGRDRLLHDFNGEPNATPPSKKNQRLLTRIGRAGVAPLGRASTAKPAADLAGYSKAKPQPTLRIVPPMSFIETVATERNGVPAKVFVDTINRLQISNSRALEIFDIPKSTAAHKIKNDGRFEGTEALATIRLKKLLSLAESIALNSLHPDAKGFDAGKWLGEWIETPQPALGGLKPADLLDTEAGGQRVLQVLAALETGTYQ